MPKLLFEISDKKHEIETDGIDIVHVRKTALEYSCILKIITSEKNVESFLQENSKIRVMIGEQTSKMIIAEGYLKGTEMKVSGEESLLTINIEDESFNVLRTTTFTGTLNGEFAREINKVTSLSGINVVKTYAESIIVNRFVNGYLFDILRDITREKSIPWNISDDKIYIGTLLSRKSHQFSYSDMRLSVGYFRDKSGVIVRKHDVTIGYKPEIKCGEILHVGKFVYIVGMVKHSYRTLKGITKKDTSLTLFGNVEDLYSFIEYSDVEDFLDDRLELKNYPFKYNEVQGVPGYYDRTRKAWLGDLECKSFTGSQLGVGQTYLSFGSMFTGANTGVFIPYDAMIVGIGYWIAGTDNAVFTVVRSGNRISIIACTTLSRRYEEMNDVFDKEGLMAVRYDPLVGAAGLAYAIVNVYYRRVIKYD